MNIVPSMRIAVRALRVNKLRSALTMLGIIIGVGAVIAMVAVGAGAQARVAEQIQSLGSNLIIVLSGSVTSSGIRLGQGSQLTISEDDATAIERYVARVSLPPDLVLGSYQVRVSRDGHSWVAVAGQLLEPLDVVVGHVADRIAEGALLARLLQPGLDDLDDG